MIGFRAASIKCPVRITWNPLAHFSQKAPAKYGQPTEWTHPHIIGPGEVNHGISKGEFHSRRDKLVDQLLRSSLQRSARLSHKTDQKHLLVLPSAKRQFMIDNIPYSYRQDTDFRYLTGCLQYDTVLVVEFTSETSKSILFCKEGTAYDEKWEGSRIGFREAVTFLGMDEAAPLSSLDSYVYDFIKINNKVNLWYDFLEPRNQDVHNVMTQVALERSSLGSMESPRPNIHQLRSVKSPAEVALMRRTCQVGAEALKKTIAASKQLNTEGELLATVEYHQALGGACRAGYPAVVASGEAACSIHYIKATQRLQEDELVLMDAGCEFHGYTSDITRTWPISGTFLPHQLRMYEAVLDTQQKLIQSIEPGRTTIDGLYRKMLVLLGKNLLDIGLIGAAEEKFIGTRAATFCPHHVSHHLGMDVHDTPSVSKTSPLLPGMVITLEPGCYVPASMEKVDPAFLGLGIRLEDDILITETGAEVLSSACPSNPKDIERLVASSR